MQVMCAKCIIGYWSHFVFLFHAVCCRTYFEYHITHWSMRDTVIPSFLTTWNQPVWYCVRACVKRKRCRAINYNIQQRKCELLGTVIFTRDVISRTKSSEYIKKTDIIIPVEISTVCHTCTLNQACSMNYTNCVQRECPTLFLENVQIVGNMVTIGAKFLAIPNVGYALSSGDSSSTCLEDGTWSNVPVPIELECETLWYKIDNSCYKFLPYAYDNAAAETICWEYMSHLVTIETEEENSALEQYLRNNYGSISNWWIGINDENEEGIWVYSHTSTGITFENWGPNEPANFGGGYTEQCAWIEKENIWADVPCNVNGNVICEKR